MNSPHIFQRAPRGGIIGALTLSAALIGAATISEAATVVEWPMMNDSDHVISEHVVGIASFVGGSDYTLVAQTLLNGVRSDPINPVLDTWLGVNDGKTTIEDGITFRINSSYDYEGDLSGMSSVTYDDDTTTTLSSFLTPFEFEEEDGTIFEVAYAGLAAGPSFALGKYGGSGKPNDDSKEGGWILFALDPTMDSYIPALSSDLWGDGLKYDLSNLTLFGEFDEDDPQIPEPSQAVSVAGLLALGLFGVRRRRVSRKSA